MSQVLARAVLICLALSLLAYTWALHKGIKTVSSCEVDRNAGTPPSGRSGEGSQVRCYTLSVEPPTAPEAGGDDPRDREVSFRVRADPAGASLREALETGSVRYCAANDVVYRARLVPGGGRRGRLPGDDMYELLLASPVDAGDPSEFPLGPAADSGYELRPSAPARLMMVFF